MFKIENGAIAFGDFKLNLPQEVKSKTPSKVFGTSTAGLRSCRGILVEINGKSGKVYLSKSETVAGHLIDNAKEGCFVHLREQLDPNNPSKTFWLISTKEIDPQLNWTTVEFTDGSVLRICPFTEYYVIKHINTIA